MKIKLPQPEYDVAELEALIAEAKQPQFAKDALVRLLTSKLGTILKIVGPCDFQGEPGFYRCTFMDGGLGIVRASDIAAATPEEIAAATRIQPKVGMLLRRKSDGAVFRVYQVSHKPGTAHVEQLTDVPCGETFQVQLLRGVSTEEYEVLDSFTLQGVL